MCIFEEKYMDTVLPVIIHKGGFGAIHQSEGIFGGLVPLDGIDPVGAVVVAGDDDAAKEFFSAFVLEVFLAPFVQHVPDKQWRSLFLSCMTRVPLLRLIKYLQVL